MANHITRIPRYLLLRPVRKSQYIKPTVQRSQHNVSPQPAGWKRSIRNGSILLAGGIVGASIIKYSLEESTTCESKVNVVSKLPDNKWVSLDEAIEESRDKIQRIKDEVGCPGLVVAVSVDGQLVWSEGLGYADIENRVPCSSKTVMRIASISKPITMAIVCKLMEEGKLDLDKPVHEYVPAWPQKTYKGEQVPITTRMLASHLAGVRHYDRTCKKHRERDAARAKAQKSNIKSDSHQENPVKTEKVDKEQTEESKLTKIVRKASGEKGDTSKPTDTKTDKKKMTNDSNLGDNVFEEFLLRRKFKHIRDVLDLFKHDELCSKPGSEFLYTTHGYTLISGVTEAVSGLTFSVLFKHLVKDLGLENTYFDESEPIIYHRSRCYVKKQSGRIVNAPYVDLSCKWAGGGMMSTSSDLVKFADAMLYSYQQSKDGAVSGGGFLKPETVQMMWTPVKGTECSWDTDGSYGLGWGVIPASPKNGQEETRFYLTHTGGAVGASSVLLVLPRKGGQIVSGRPEGVSVAIISNLPNVGLNKTALSIAKLFEQVH